MVLPDTLAFAGSAPLILTRTTYIGEHRFNRRSHKDREKKPENEVAVMACPPLIDRQTFEVVQARLKARDPRMTPARVASGPTLLTGVCFCAKYGGAMTLRTAKARAYAIVNAFEVVDHHPEEATETDLDLVAATTRDEWQRAFTAVIEAEGGLEAVVRKAIGLLARDLSG